MHRGSLLVPLSTKREFLSLEVVNKFVITFLLLGHTVGTLAVAWVRSAS
jgi:hypothetical protein